MRRFIALTFLIAAGTAFGQNYTVRTIAGGGLPLGAANTAILYGAQGLATDAAGNLYLSLRTRHVVLRRDAASGQLTVVAGTGVAGLAGDNGPATSAQLAFPDGIAFDRSGNLYIADTLNNRIRRVGTNGVITTFAGSTEGFSGDGAAAVNAQLRRPSDVTVDQSGAVYIADTSNHRIRRVVSGTISTYAGSGVLGFSGDGGTATLARLSSPRGVAVGASGAVYIADTGNHRVRVVSGGNISTFAGNGSTTYNGDNIAPAAASLADPDKVLSGPDGILYIADTAHHRVRRVLGSAITTVAGNGTGGFAGDGGPATSALLNRPTGLALHSNGDLYITDSVGGRIRRVLGTSATIGTVAGASEDLGPNGDGGPATSARLNNPRGVAVGSGAVYISDQNGYRIRRVLNGNIATFAGTGSRGSTGDSGPALTVSLGLVEGLHVDSQGRLYVADWGVDRVRRIAGGTVTTVAGNGQYGHVPSQDGGPATEAALAAPSDTAVDAAGNFYIADRRNHRIRKVTPQGVITTFAGSGSGGSAPGDFSGDNGPATSARLNQPQSIAIDTARNRLYFTDSANHVIRMVDLATNIIRTVAGTPREAGYAGDNGLATSALLAAPVGVAVDTAGNLYIADTQNQVIRKVTASTGRITTIAGGAAAFADNVPATNSRFATPTDLDVDAAGNIYVTDTDNTRIRVLSPEPVTITTPSPLPNGAAGVPYTLTFAAAGGLAPYTWTMVGTPPAGLTLATNTGVLSGTPTTPVSNQPFSVRVRDSQGLTDENPYTLTIVSCTATFNPPAISVAAAGVTSATVAVVRDNLCGQWTAASTQQWVAILAGGSGRGNGSIQYRVDANPTGTQRTAQITVAGAGVTITQAAPGCSATVQPSPLIMASAAGTASITVNPTASCGQWSVTNLPAWLTVVSGSPATGPGTVVLRAEANTAGTARTATITVAGQQVTVTQREAPCRATFAAPASAAIPDEATTRQVPFTLPTGCTNTSPIIPAQDQAWLTATVSGRTLSFTAQANPSSVGRTSKVRVADADFTINQAGAACNITLAPASRIITSVQTAGTFAVNLPAGCGWQAAADVPWLQVTAGSTGSGAGSVSFTASARSEAGPRTGTITVGTRTFTVVQNGTAPNMTCQATATSPTVRREGLSERAGDVTLTCTGVPAAGTLADVDLTLENTTVTSRALDELKTATEALAILNNAAAPQLGTTAWQAGIASPATLRWQGIRITPANSSGQATLRLTNIRVNANAGSETIRANVSLRSTTRIALPTVSVQIATAQTGVVANRGNIVAGPGAGQMTVPIIFREQLASAFRTRAGESGYINGSITAGQADTGTRLRVFLKLPASVRISAPRVTEGGEFARLVSADVNGTGGSEVAGTGYQPLTPAQDGAVAATWEIKAATAGLDTLTFPLVFEGATTAQLETITASMVAGTGPVATSEVATLGSPIPRFKDIAAFVQPVDLSVVPATLRVVSLGSASATSAAKTSEIRAQQGPSTSVTADIDALNSATVGSGPTTVKSSIAADLTFDRTRTTAVGGQVTFSDDMKEARIRYANFNPGEKKRISLGLSGDLAPGEFVELVTTVQSDMFDPIPGDNTASVPINTPACNSSLNPVSATNVPAAGITGQFTVTASCDWTAQSSDDWVTITPRAGTGSLLVSYTVAPNPTNQPRTTTIVAAGRTFEITQLPNLQLPPCQLSAPGTQVSGAGGVGGFSVTGCDPRSATTTTPWIILTTSPSWVAFSAATNTTAAARTGTITVGAATYTVSQAAGDGCSFALSTSTVNAAAVERDALTVNVTVTPNTCSWTAASAVPWIQVSTGQGKGSQAFSFLVNPSARAVPRTGKLVIAGQELTVAQAPSGMAENRRLVQLLFFNLIGRTPAAGEIDFWVNQGLPRQEMAARMIGAGEFNSNSRFSSGLYVGILTRDPEYGGWLFQRNHLGKNATAQNINNLQKAFTVNFLNSEEYRLKFGTPSNADFIRLLYRNILGREASQADVDFQVGQLEKSPHIPLDERKAQIAANFLNSGEFISGKGGRMLSFLYYAAILQRLGDANERKRIEDAVAASQPVSEIIAPLVNSEEFSNLLR